MKYDIQNIDNLLLHVLLFSPLVVVLE